MIDMHLSELVLTLMFLGLGLWLLIWWMENMRRRSYEKDFANTTIYCRSCRLRYRYYGHKKQTTCPHCQTQNDARRQRTTI